MSSAAQTHVDESTTGRHIPALDGIRGLAVLMVLLCHLFVRNPTPNASLPVRVVTLLFASGWTGVDLFFVLSGFLITGILYDTRESPHFFRNFYARRALRIFPLYYAFLLLLIVISVAQGHHWYLRGTLLYLTYLHTLLLGPVGYSTAPWVNINHLWSLAIEEQFYFIWPVSVFLLATKRRIVAGALVGTAISIAIRCWAEWSGLVHTYPYAVYSWTPACLDGLLGGAVLAMLVRSRIRNTVLRWAPRVFLAGEVLILTLLFTLPSFSPIYSPFMATIGYVLLAVMFCGLIGSALRVNSTSARLFSNSLLRMFGRYSYGLYVYHFFLHGLLEHRFHSFFEAHTHSKLLSLFGTGSVLLLLSLALAALSFHFFEQPILQLKRYFPDRGNRPKLRQDVASASRQAAA